MRIELIERTQEEKAFEILAEEFDAYHAKAPSDIFDFDGYDAWRAQKPARVVTFEAVLSGELSRSILVPLAGV